MHARQNLCAALSLTFLGGCASLPAFGSDLGKQEISGAVQRPAYVSMRSFYGHIIPGAEADEVVDGKKMFYVYVWVPAVTPELGVRMLSPAKSYASPQAGDFVDGTYLANKGSDVYFDTWIRLERCLAAVNPEDIMKPCAQWVAFAENDDSAEVPAQPNGTQSNALVRVQTSMDDPLKALVRGVYRIAFTAQKIGEVQGSFLAQVGAPVELPGMAMARTPAELTRALGDKGAVSRGAAVSP